MASADNHWGTLINSDKSPAPLLEQLCLGIAQLMSSFDSNGTTDITPDRLAAFYRKVGGNYDPLFLETKTQALSFIYQSLGCFHSLQPSTNPYEPPSIPSLLPSGFVRWQTIQLLMDPDEHSVYLQNAVELWDIVDANGEIFPKTIPRDAFPSEPDPEMLEWHEGVSRRLERDYLKRHTKRASPPDFGSYHYHFSGKDPLPDEDDYFSRPRRAASKRQSYAQPDQPSDHRHHRRHHSGEYPAFTARRPGANRPGFSTPRVSSPPPWGERERPARSSRRDQAGRHSHPLSPETGEVSDVSDVSSDESARHRKDRSKSNRHQERRHLSPPSNSSARRHSHEAYTRRPFRDLSPTSSTRQRRSHESHPSRSSKSHSEPSPKVHPRDHARDYPRDRDHPRDYPKDHPKDRSRSRTAGVKFREFIFGDTAPAPAAPDPPFYRPPTPPPPRAVPRHLGTYAADDMRRGSYSGGSTGNSRPSSGGSGSERQRSYSSAGFHPRTTGWASPRTSASKRYNQAAMPEDDRYVPSRRVPIYE
ncbi:uncharacterized protein N7479_010086 [Penicillium vulpinum]|uniref:DUF7514 domain-containing protein n=1 Tax=Penicillium vulpinum TaxID=29845 RepID=A0A1V6RVQ3_9EURO|nr:uncharacterized protein N7479_010086 [Penicillium vulpinum]KAJ5951673.1 hypothetical protein N7479_010086 [Penicillium vulpinum]OQE05584.1 hypothetical protein PENVUL_c023G08266 [Penicillium vulpinum]